jgi:hypothetical protein
MAVTILQDLARQCGLKPASELDPLVEPRTAPLPFSAPVAAPDFVVIDVETACNRASSICQIGIVGFAANREVFAYETLVDPQDVFSPFNTRLHGSARNTWPANPASPASMECCSNTSAVASRSPIQTSITPRSRPPAGPRACR